MGRKADRNCVQDGFLQGRRTALEAALHLGVLLPLFLFAGSVLLLGVVGAIAQSIRPQALFVLILFWIAAWIYASFSIFRCALNEQKHTWFAGALLFIVPFQAWGVVTGLINNVEGILGLLRQ